MRKVDSSEERDKHSRANNSHAFYPLTCSLGLAIKLTSSYRKGPNLLTAKAPYLIVVSFCKTYTAVSRNVGKNVHATIPKGNRATIGNTSAFRRLFWK